MTDPDRGSAIPQAETDEAANAAAMREGAIAAAERERAVERAALPLTTGNLDLALDELLNSRYTRWSRDGLKRWLETIVRQAVRDELELAGLVQPRDQLERRT